MRFVIPPEAYWFAIGVIVVWLVSGCLRIIGFEYRNAVRWHDLRVRVQRLRLEQKRHLEAIEADAARMRPVRSLRSRAADAAARRHEAACTPDHSSTS